MTEKEQLEFRRDTNIVRAAVACRKRNGSGAVGAQMQHDGAARIRGKQRAAIARTVQRVSE